MGLGPQVDKPGLLDIMPSLLELMSLFFDVVSSIYATVFGVMPVNCAVLFAMHFLALQGCIVTYR